MTTPLEAMRLALEALKYAKAWDDESDATHYTPAITALQSAIKQMESVEPVAWGIARLDADYRGWITCRMDREGEFTTPLYAHPAPAVPSYDATKWQLVPVEPVDEMLEAWKNQIMSSAGRDEFTAASRAYKSMLQAAPKPEDI